MKITIYYNVICEDCGEVLGAYEYLKSKAIMVIPCKNCMNQEYDLGSAVGTKKGKEEQTLMTENIYKEICKNCGCTYGSHHGGTSPYPRNYCPGTESGMDWENGPGTTFESSRMFKEDSDDYR